MHVLSRLSWLLAAVGAAAVKTSGVVEVDLVFPRNDTYAPTPLMPIVFAIQNSELARLVNPHISFTVWNWDNRSDTVITFYYDLRWVNFSRSDPYFEYRAFSGFNTEGNWWITWTVGRDSCTEDSLSGLSPSMILNSTGSSVLFTTKNAAQPVDLVAATSNGNCPEHLGVAFNVTSTLKVPARVEWSGDETCAVLASPPPTPDPCRVRIDSAAASSISSSIAAKWCTATNSPVSCPPDAEKSAAQQLSLGGVAWRAATLGALGYFLT